MSEHEQLKAMIHEVEKKIDSVHKRLEKLKADPVISEERLIDRKEVEELTGMSHAWCHKRLDHYIPRVSLGGAVRYRLKDVMEYIRSNTSKPI